MQRSQEADPDSSMVSHDKNSRAHIFRLSGEQADSSDHGVANGMEGGAKRRKLRALASKTKAKTKKLLRTEDGESEDEGSHGEGHGVLGNLERDPAFNHNKLYKQKRRDDRGSSNKPVGALESIANTVIRPKSAIKSKATRTTAGQLAKAERPFISQNADLELLEAHDSLHHAETSRLPKQATSDSEGEDVTIGCRERVKELQEQRESLRAAWTTSRHVRRVRVVPKRHMDFPDNDSFTRKDANGEHFDWLSWLGYVQLAISRISRSCTDFK